MEEDVFMQDTKIFVTRDKDGTLTLFNREPIRGTHSWYSHGCDSLNEFVVLPVDFISFADLSWEDKPLELQTRQVRKIKEYAVGEVFELSGQKYKVIAQRGCKHCAFRYDSDTCTTMTCAASCRNDDTTVQFIRI